MKKNVLGSLALAVLFVFGAIAAFGQTSQTLNISVPFDFIVADTTLPAGAYRVVTIANGTANIIQRLGGGSSAVFCGYNQQPKESMASFSGMTFTRYDDKHFLSGVWFGPGFPGKRVQQTPYEKEMIAKVGNAPAVRVLGASSN